MPRVRPCLLHFHLEIETFAKRRLPSVLQQSDIKINLFYLCEQQTDGMLHAGVCDSCNDLFDGNFQTILGINFQTMEASTLSAAS